MARSIVKEGKFFKVYDDGCVRIDMVRASYPHLDKPWAKNEGDNAKFSITGLGDKDTHDAAKSALVEIINKLCLEKKFGKLGSDKKFIRNGDDAGGEENENMWVIKASENPKRPPKLRSRNGSTISPSEVEAIIYPGCYVNILIRPWAQDSKEWGKRINANLIAVQFWEDGERFGEAPIDDEGVFDEADDGMGGVEDDDL